MVRKPQVAGQFYPAEAAALKRQLEQLVEPGQKRQKAYGLVVPHAGYVYSGKVAGSCFSRVQLSKTVIILGPNHSGLGPPFSIMAEGTWRMPLGDVAIDQPLAQALIKGGKYLQADSDAHLHEHSIEVQLPFLQYLLPELKIVPIVIGGADFEKLEQIGQTIARVLTATKRDCLVVASSDMTHYQPEEVAKQNDELAIEAILKLDAAEFFRRVEQHNISICGYAPIVGMLSAAKASGATEARLVQYQTSGVASGDYSSVVGYAGIIIQ